MKKIVIAPDSFKGTLSSLQVCNIVKESLLEERDDLEIIEVPIADGGEGMTESFMCAFPGSEKIELIAKSPLGRDIEVYYAIVSGDTAVIEVSANTRTLIRLVLEGLMNESLPDTSNYVGSFDKYVVDYSIAENKNAFLTAYTASLEVKPEEPEVPAHTHTACPECGKCTAADCDGTDTDKCAGHTPVEPEQPKEITYAEAFALVSAELIADFEKVNGLAAGTVTGANFWDNSDGGSGKATYNFVNDATYNAKWAWLFAFLKANAAEDFKDEWVRVESMTASTGDNNDSWAIRTEIGGFLQQTAYSYAGWIGTSADYSAAAIQEAFLAAYKATLEVKPEEPEVPAHEHTLCPECGKCTAEDCDGADTDKCQGHAPVETSVTKTMASYGWAQQAQQKAFNLDDNISVSIAGGTNSGKYYADGGIRIYATDQPAGSITITAAEGYTIKSISFTLATNGTYAFLQLDGVTVTNGQVVEINAASATFNTVKNGSNGKQVRIAEITVVYVAE